MSAGLGLSGNMASLKRFTASLRELPTVVAQKVAAASADTLTDVGRKTFDASEDAYGNTWEPGAEGQVVTLQKTGALERGLRYVAIGTKLRVAMAVRYAKYQLGKRPAFPRQGDPLPTAYVEALKTTTAAVIRAELGTP